MSDYQTYEARADAGRARAVAGTESPFSIVVRFLGGLTQTQMDAFAAAADRWVKVIVGDLPDVTLDGEVIDDVLILAKGEAIDGTGMIVGEARITDWRPDTFLPVRGEMTFDAADLATMETTGILTDVITHEMGHVLGIGSLWDVTGLLAGKGGADPTFTGPGAMAEYQKLTAGDEPVGVPVENTGGPGTRDVHWRERTFGNELMTGFVDRVPNPLSRVTAASLGDLGYQVDVDAADRYALPAAGDLVKLADRRPRHGAAGTVVAPVERRP